MNDSKSNIKPSQPSVSQPPASLNNFQKSFSDLMRDQSKSIPEELPNRPVEIYRRLLFNNTCNFIDSCFPVAQSIVATHTWQQLKVAFYKNWHSHSPLFNDIPFQFYQFVESNHIEATLPHFFSNLLHYEWLELSVELAQNEITKPKVSFTIESNIKVNPTLNNLKYDWPVHKICSDYLPEQAKETYLIVFRDHQHQVRFIEANPLTSHMISLLTALGSAPISTLLDKLHQTQPELEHEVIMHFGQQLIVDLVQQNAIIVE